MSSIPPSLSLTVNTQKRACILDIPLALSKYGLLLSQRLGEEFNIWIVREMWGILDNTQYYLSHPDSLLIHGPDEEISDYSTINEGLITSETLSQWELARNRTDLAGLKVFWINDSLNESFLPPGVDQEIISRYEILAKSLEIQSQKRNHKSCSNNIFVACFRDAAALTASLTRYRSFILTLQHNSKDFTQTEPLICSYMKDWGIKCRKIRSENKSRFERAFFSSIFSRAGISELIWSGMSLAVIYLFMPDVSILPLTSLEENLSDDLVFQSNKEELSRKNWWKGSSCFWISL
jgi:hypothetical protein